MKKLPLILAALALTLGLSQCKKQETPTTNESVHITLTASYGQGGAKTGFNPATGAFTWTGTSETPEYIYVGGNSTGYLGYLTSNESGSTVNFSGTITPSAADATLFFFYFGKGGERTGDALNSVDFSNQDGTLPNVTNYHIAISEGVAYTAGQTSFTTTLNMAMAIAYFDVNGFKNANETAETVYLHGDEVYSTATIDYQSGTIAGSTKGSINLGTANDGKYVALIPSVNTETTLKFDSDSKTGAMTFLRGIQAGKYYANSDAALSVAANSCLFSVSGAKKVRFSQGNLQYTKSTGVWSFMEHQYDIVETSGLNVGDDYANKDVVSLFGYGTSGYNNNQSCYQPYCTHVDQSGSASYASYLTGTANWGYNRISNGGNTENFGWYVMSSSEWEYVIKTRAASTVNGTEKARYAKAKVAGIQGVILFPDSYTHPDGVAQPKDINVAGNAGWNENNYTAAEFGLMEAHGVVFLPAAGRRSGTSVSNSVGAQGSYWLSTYHNGTSSDYMNILDVNINYSWTSRDSGLSVRLVRDVQ